MMTPAEHHDRAAELVAAAQNSIELGTAPAWMLTELAHVHALLALYVPQTADQVDARVRTTAEADEDDECMYCTHRAWDHNPLGRCTVAACGCRRGAYL